ncbi:hypothetical protein [Barrientosiimonas endolithica]|uniref:Uncharacterized protein n=1 Tax=Barrientosiimonas endolithica TaxID=1535208 RepID=A0ABM8HAC9_9MICO|nr:hypothetical protein [Barrientosiimonas endolithica]BDZ57867.1 hypothetical protein GCM10025872_15240 [Barrientosiimonas endolithica]
MTDAKLCPRCGGEWLWSFTFQHRVTCPLLAQEDVTKIDDSTKLRTRSAFARHATDAELELAAVWEPAAALALDGSTQTGAETTVRGTPRSCSGSSCSRRPAPPTPSTRDATRR